MLSTSPSSELRTTKSSCTSRWVPEPTTYRPHQPRVRQGPQENPIRGRRNDHPRLCIAGAVTARFTGPLNWLVDGLPLNPGQALVGALRSPVTPPPPLGRRDVYTWTCDNLRPCVLMFSAFRYDSRAQGDTDTLKRFLNRKRSS